MFERASAVTCIENAERAIHACIATFHFCVAPIAHGPGLVENIS